METAREAALELATSPSTRTQWEDERWDVPPIHENDRAGYQSWLRSTGFRAASHPDTWQAIKANWIGFLSASGGKPSAVLAPNRKKVQFHGGSETQQQRDNHRFQTDRQTRRAVQIAVWKVFDSLEALTERWPAQARRILNQVTDLTSTKPFQTLVARPSLHQRRRFNAVWTSLLCFLVYAYDDEGSLEEMGLRLSEEMSDSILDIAEAEVWSIAPPSMDGPMGQLEAAVEALCLEMIMDPEPTITTNPLLWWMGVLVHSSLMPLEPGMDDYISRGKFHLNILPMDIDARTRIEALQHYAKVLLLDRIFNTWETSPARLQEVQRELNMVSNEWLNAETDQRPPVEDDPRTCQSAAWRSLLDHLKRESDNYLGGQDGTVLGVAQALFR
jgi:hypothetical protein